MSILQLIEVTGAAVGGWISDHPVKALFAALGILLGSTITVKRLELPVYRWARDWLNARLAGFGKRINAQISADVAELTTTVGVLTETVGNLSQELQSQKETADRRRADDYRREILSFNREIMEGRCPDRESYVEALAIVDRYHKYCREHEDYPNSRATAAIENIRQHYQHCLVVGFQKEDT